MFFLFIYNLILHLELVFFKGKGTEALLSWGLIYMYFVLWPCFSFFAPITRDTES